MLKDLYKILIKNPNDSILVGLKLYHSDIHYIRVHLNSKFKKNYTLEEVFTLLVEEGLIKEEDLERYGPYR